MHLASDRLRPALDGELGGVVESVARECTYAGDGGHVEDEAAAVVLCLAHNANGFRGDADGAEEVRLELLVHFLLGGGFGVTGQGVARIVDEDVEVEVGSKVSGGGFESVTNGRWLGDIQG